MHHKHTLPLFLALVLQAPATMAADAQEVVAKVLQTQQERREGVNSYTVQQSVMGQTVDVVFERTTVTGPDGEPIDTFQVRMPAGFGGNEEEMSRKDLKKMSQNSIDAMHEIAEQATVVGNETVDGRDAFHLQATDLNRVEDLGGNGEFTMSKIDVWIDSDKYVPLRMVMDGTMDTDGTPRPITMEIEQMDYRDVPDSTMYESYKQIMRMNGEMSDEMKAQVEEARKGLEEFEKQMETMPESQRQMMMNMMGDQIEMMRKLAAGDGIEIVTEVIAITVN